MGYCRQYDPAVASRLAAELLPGSADGIAYVTDQLGA